MSDTPPLGMDRPARPPSPTDGAAGAGAMLRHAREAAGVHLASLAMSLKVPVARLEALESGRIDLLPDPVFARALAASVCRSLRIDPQPVLNKLPRTAATPVAAEPVLHEAPSPSSFKPKAQSATAANRSRSPAISRPLGILIVLLLAVTAVLIFVPDLNWSRLTGGGLGDSTTTPSVVTSTAPAAGAGNDRVAQAGAASQRPVGQTASAAAASATATAALPAIAAAASASAVPSATPPLRPASTAPASVASTPPAADNTLSFETSVPAWVQVIDAKGNALVRKTVPANETVRVSSADLPLRVTVGQSDKTRVSVRGEPMDLAAVSRGGVARFEVK